MYNIQQIMMNKAKCIILDNIIRDSTYFAAYSLNVASLNTKCIKQKCSS